MTTHDVVTKLIGPIQPQGITEVDNIRYGNLEEMCTLVDKLLFDINQVAKGVESAQYSVKKAAVYAENFLSQVKEQ